MSHPFMIAAVERRVPDAGRCRCGRAYVPAWEAPATLPLAIALEAALAAGASAVRCPDPDCGDYLQVGDVRPEHAPALKAAGCFELCVASWRDERGSHERHWLGYSRFGALCRRSQQEP